MRVAALVFGGILILFVPASFVFKWSVPGLILVGCLAAGAGLVAFAAQLVDKLKVSRDGFEAQDDQ